jgi:hypothetical protein
MNDGFGLSMMYLWVVIWVFLYNIIMKGLLLVVAVMLAMVESDLPIHCVSSLVKGTWLFYI